MKYIDADKLRKVIEDKGLDCSFALKMERLDTLALIDEFQQEQTEPTCKTCGFYENNCPFIRGKLIPYPNKVCKDYTYSAMKEQEQPEVDLEKLGEIARHIIAVKQNVEDMRLNKDEWSLLERIGYPERFNARKEELPSNLDEAAEEIVKDWLAYGDGEYKKLVIAGVEWMAGHGVTVKGLLYGGSLGIPDIPEEFYTDKEEEVIVQIRKKLLWQRYLSTLNLGHRSRAESIKWKPKMEEKSVLYAGI